MNRLTAIGLASLVAYGLLIASKYTGVVSAARDDKAPRVGVASVDEASAVEAVAPPAAQNAAPPVEVPAPVARLDAARASAVAVEFRRSHDLKAFADALMARKGDLTSDERYHLAKALEECQFTMSINEDMATYAAKQRRQFLANLPLDDPNNAKRLAAYEAVDNTQRCARFQGTKISQKDVDDLFQAAAQQGDVRAQARMLVAELNKNLSSNQHTEMPRSRPRASAPTTSRA